MSDKYSEHFQRIYDGLDLSDALALNSFVAIHNEITTLEARIAELEGDSGWISVKDRLPEKYDEYGIHPSVELQNYHNEAEYSPKENKWTITEYNSWGSDDHQPFPTHWRVLTPPPKDI